MLVFDKTGQIVEYSVKIKSNLAQLIQFHIASNPISPGLTVQAAPQSIATPRRPSDPLPHAPLPHAPPPRQQPVKAELVTTELDDEPQNNPRLQQQQQSNGLQQAPPPYHIAAARSKQASTFSALHTSTNGNSHNNSNNVADGNSHNNANGSANHANNINKKANGGSQVRCLNFISKEIRRQAQFGSCGYFLSMIKMTQDGFLDSLYT